MKEKYLSELTEILANRNVNQDEIKSIIIDYNEIIDDALASGLLKHEVINKIGTPKEVYRS